MMCHYQFMSCVHNAHTFCIHVWLSVMCFYCMHLQCDRNKQLHVVNVNSYILYTYSSYLLEHTCTMIVQMYVLWESSWWRVPLDRHWSRGAAPGSSSGEQQTTPQTRWSDYPQIQDEWPATWEETMPTSLFTNYRRAENFDRHLIWGGGHI